MRHIRASKQTIFLLLLVFSLLSAMLGQWVARPLRRVAYVVLAPLSDMGTRASTAIESKVAEIKSPTISQDDARRLEQENQVLGAQVDSLAQRIIEKDRQIGEILKVRQMCDPNNDLPCDIIPARVIGNDSLPYGQTLIVTPGQVREGSPVTTRLLLTNRSKALPTQLSVVTSTTLVGRVVDTGAFAARLQLLTDRAFRIDARVRRVLDPAKPRTINAMRGSTMVRQTLTNENNVLVDVMGARGDGDRHVAVVNVKDESQIMPGDELVTRGDDRFMPAQILIGKVVDVQGDPKHAGFVSLTVAPAADLDSLREVFIIAPTDEKLTEREGVR